MKVRDFLSVISFADEGYVIFTDVNGNVLFDTSYKNTDKYKYTFEEIMDKEIIDVCVSNDGTDSFLEIEIDVEENYDKDFKIDYLFKDLIQ